MRHGILFVKVDLRARTAIDDPAQCVAAAHYSPLGDAADGAEPMRVETLAATLARTIVAAHALSCGFVCNVPVATLGTQQPSWGQCFSVHQLSPEPGQGVIIFRQVSTGVFEAVVKAVETTDQCLEKVMETAKSEGYAVVVIADHGNADLARNVDGTPHTAHTTNPVPIWVYGASSDVADGILADVAPTVLDLMGLVQPQEMTGRSLLD